MSFCNTFSSSRINVANEDGSARGCACPHTESSTINKWLSLRKLLYPFILFYFIHQTSDQFAGNAFPALELKVRIIFCSKAWVGFHKFNHTVFPSHRLIQIPESDLRTLCNVALCISQRRNRANRFVGAIHI